MQVVQTLSERGLRSVADLAKDRQHGDRLRYMAGCRCSDCRRANTSYETARAAARKAGDWNGIVSADKARAHMAALSAAGVGRHTVSDVSGIADSILFVIGKGSKLNIRARTERKILAVTQAAAADRALIPAGPSWALLDELIAGGYTKAFLAQQLGAKTRALQLNRHLVTVRNAYNVARLHERLRLCPAGPTQSLIAELREEGYRVDVINRHVVKLAAETNMPAPEMTVRNGNVQVLYAQLIARVHASLTE